MPIPERTVAKNIKMQQQDNQAAIEEDIFR